MKISRFLCIAAASCLLVTVARADPPVGDFIDQAMRALPPAPGSPPAPLAAPVQAVPVAAAPGIMPSAPAGFAPGGGDIVDRAVQAHAAPVGSSPPPPAWTGLYAGINIGHATSRGGGSESCKNSITGTSSGCQIILDSELGSSGFFGGGQIGYNTPLPFDLTIGDAPLIVGVEADLQGADLSKSQTTNGPFNTVDLLDVCSPCSYTSRQQVNWMGTLRGRVGVPVDQFLIYGTGGLVVGSVSASQIESFNGEPGYVANATSTLSGPTVGGGVEVLAPGGLPVSAKLEGLYYDMGTLQTIAVPQSNFATNFNNIKTFGFRGTMIRLGVNMHLGDLGIGN